MDTLIQDLRYAARTMARTPGFALTIVLVLTLGIAANTAIFGLVNNVLLRPLPFGEPERLVQLFETYTVPGGSGTGAVSVPNYEDWREQSQSYEDLALVSLPASANLQSDGDPERIATLAASANLFSVLRAPPALGRTFADEDGADVVVLSHGFWQQRFGGEANVVGSTITLDGRPFVVAGVMPRAFRFPAQAGIAVDAWRPLQVGPDQAQNRGSHAFHVIGRLRDGVSVEAAEAELRHIAAGIAELFPTMQEDRSAVVRPLREVSLGNVRAPLLVLLGAAGFLLLIACANAANLLLARATARSREVTIRAALGATRGRLARQLLAESALLTTLAAVFGVMLAWWGSEAVNATTARLLPAEPDFALDVRVLLFLVGITTLTVLAFGFAPALHGTRTDLQSTLREGRQGLARSGHGARSLLVVCQVALSVVLLIGAGLLMRTFVSLMSTETGMRTDNVLTMRIAVPPDRFEGGIYNQFYQPVLEQTRALAGVQEAGLVSHLPLREWGFNGSFGIVGRTFTPAQMPFAEFRAATPGYFGALGIPVVRGRPFGEEDSAGAPTVIISEAVAKRWFPDVDPIGQQLVMGTTPITIIGVVGDIRQVGLDALPQPEIYFPYAQVEQFGTPMTLVVATGVDPLSLVPAIRAVIRAVDPLQTVYAVTTMRQVVRSSVADRTLYLWLLGGFAAVALLLAVAGIYGVISYTVTQRTQEIGVRIALGSEPDAVKRLIIWQGTRLALVGLAIGLAGAAAVTRIIGNLLHGVAPTDPLTFAGVGAVLAIVAMAASYIPARRAARVSPMVALRTD